MVNMNCPKCGAPNRDGAKFCVSCKNMFSAPPTEVVPVQDRSPPPDPFIPTPKLVAKTGPNWTIIAVAVIIVAIVILFFFIIFFVSPLFSQESDYRSGTACPIRSRDCGCLGLEYEQIVFPWNQSEGGANYSYCLGVVSECVCYSNKCPFSSGVRSEIDCSSVEVDPDAIEFLQ